MTTTLEKRIEALEKIILKAPTAIASHAVDLLMAVPDEEAKISSMLRIVDNVKPEIHAEQSSAGHLGTSSVSVREKITTHINEYDAFVTEAQESYAGILKQMSHSMIFKIKYFKAKNNEKKLGQLLEETEGVNCDEYQEALVAYALSRSDKEKVLDKQGLSGQFGTSSFTVKKIVEKIKPEILLKVSSKIKAIADEELKYLTAKQLMKSEDSEILAEAIKYAKEVELDDKKRKVFMKRADELLESEKNVKQAIALIDIVLKEEKDYEKLLQAGKKLLNVKEDSDKYFERALDSSDSVNERELEKTADYLLGERKYELAKEFYKKVLRDEEKWEKYRGIAQVLVKAGQKESAEEILERGVEFTKSLDDYLDMNDPVLNEKITYRMDVIVNGLKRFDKTSDYKKTVQWVEERYGKEGVIGFVDEIKSKYLEKLNKSGIKFLNEYKAKIEKEIKDKEEAERKTREEAWKKRQEEMEKELRRKRKEDERLRKLTEEIMEERSAQQLQSNSWHPSKPQTSQGKETALYEKFEEMPNRYIIRDATIDGIVRDIQISKQKLEEGKKFNQDKWDELTRNKEFKVPSLIDYTAIAIELYKNKDGPQKDLVEKIRQMLADDFENEYVMTSTKIKYNLKGKDAITHNFKPIASKWADIKNINGEKLEQNKNLEDAIQILCGTRNVKEAKQAYEWLTGRATYLYTSEYERYMAVVLGRNISNYRFDIYCDGNIYVIRPARGVVVGAPKNPAKTSQNLAEEIMEERQIKPAPIGNTNTYAIPKNSMNINDDKIIQNIIEQKNTKYLKNKIIEYNDEYYNKRVDDLLL